MTNTDDKAQVASDKKNSSTGTKVTAPMKSFTEATEAFIAAATWLSDADLPMVTALQQAAAELDANGVQAALLNTYGVTYRTLLKAAANSDGAFDEDEDFLNGP